MRLSARLEIEKGVTAIIGSGGKTTMMHLLAGELCAAGTVIVTTSTHICPPETLPCLISPTQAQIAAALQKHPILCVGSLNHEGKLAACALPFETLASLADYVLVEADGSKRLPLKAHAPHEPVIPKNCRKTICVIGASGLGRPIREAVHRPELFCAMTGASPEDAATPERVAAVLNREALADLYYINQCELPAAAAEAERLAALLSRPAILGSLRQSAAAGETDPCSTLSN